MLFRLLIFLLVLGLGFLGWWWYTTDPKSETFETELMRLDTARVDAIEIVLPASEEKLLLRRTATHWLGNRSFSSFRVLSQAVDSLLAPVTELQSTGLDKDTSWELPPVRISYFHNGEIEGTLLVGGVSDSLTTRTEVGLADRPDRYFVAGDLRPYFNRPLAAYRHHGFLALDTTALRSVGISLGPDQVVSWELGKPDRGDTADLRDWLAGLEQVEGDQFDDAFDPIAHSEDLFCSIQFTYPEPADRVALYIYRDTMSSAEFILNSSQYPRHFFRSDSAGLFAQVFPTSLIPEVILTPDR